MQRLIPALALLVLVPCSSTFSQQSEVINTVQQRLTESFQWQDFSVRYPAGRWEMETIHKDDKRCLFRLNPMSDQEIVLNLSFVRDMPTNDAHYNNNPHMMNTTVLLSPALELAGNDESKIFLGTGASIIPSGWGTSARATVLGEGGKAYLLEGCHDFDQSTGNMVMALLMTQTQAGQVNKDPAYAEKLVEAYSIIKSVKMSATVDSAQSTSSKGDVAE